MSEAQSPELLPPESTTVPVPTVPSVPVARLTSSLVLTVAVGDWLLWQRSAGLGAGLFVLLMTGLILLNRPCSALKPRHLLMTGLILLSAVQTAIRPSLSNFISYSALLLLLAGDTWYTSLKQLGSRWIREVWASLRVLRSWIDYIGACRRAVLSHGGKGGRGVLRLWEVSWLAVALVVVFSIVLGFGNERFGALMSDALSWFQIMLTQIALPHPARVILWGTLATVALLLLFPPRVKSDDNVWLDAELERFANRDIKLAILRTAVALAAVNVLFFLNNSLDVVHLWICRELPGTMMGRYSEYVHDGVYSLIIAVILSACMLAVLFQQSKEVVRSKWLKGLALLWVAQNLFLGLGVLLRLKLYVDAHWLTPKRVYVALFLVLIAAGYVLLTRYILKEGSFKRLLMANLLVVFCLFFSLQFVNVPALVADYNYHQWRQAPEKSIAEVELEQVLGREMVPLLAQIVTSGESTPAVAEARRSLSLWQHDLAIRVNEARWQESQWRRAQLLSIANVALHEK